VTAPDLLAEVRAAADALALAEARRLAAVRAAIAAHVDRSDIAASVGMTRDGLYKWLRRTADHPPLDRDEPA
jgi:DNA-binding phage protein